MEKITFIALFVDVVEMMGNRYRNKYEPNGMYPFPNIKSELPSDDDADNNFGDSSNEMTQFEFN